jgi:DNA-binding MarR family transcriptional regulator
MDQPFVVPPVASSAPPAARPSKAKRMLEKLFPEAPRYVPRKGTYSAMPWVLRRAVGLFSVREWQVLTYLYLRSGPESLVWMSDKQIAIDLDVGARKVGPHIRALVAKGFLKAAEHDGVRYLLLLDAEAALRGLAASGGIPKRVLEQLGDDFEVIGLRTLTPPPTAAGGDEP